MLVSKDLFESAALKFYTTGEKGQTGENGIRPVFETLETSKVWVNKNIRSKLENRLGWLSYERQEGIGLWRQLVLGNTARSKNCVHST